MSTIYSNTSLQAATPVTGPTRVDTPGTSNLAPDSGANGTGMSTLGANHQLGTIWQTATSSPSAPPPHAAAPPVVDLNAHDDRTGGYYPRDNARNPLNLRSGETFEIHTNLGPSGLTGPVRVTRDTGHGTTEEVPLGQLTSPDRVSANGSSWTLTAPKQPGLYKVSFPFEEARYEERHNNAFAELGLNNAEQSDNDGTGKVIGGDMYDPLYDWGPVHSDAYFTVK